MTSSSSLRCHFNSFLSCCCCSAPGLPGAFGCLFCRDSSAQHELCGSARRGHGWVFGSASWWWRGELLGNQGNTHHTEKQRRICVSQLPLPCCLWQVIKNGLSLFQWWVTLQALSRKHKTLCLHKVHLAEILNTWSGFIAYLKSGSNKEGPFTKINAGTWAFMRLQENEAKNEDEGHTNIPHDAELNGLKRCSAFNCIKRT